LSAFAERSTVGHQSIAMPLQPGPRARVTRSQTLDKTPKALSVVHLYEVRDFMGNDMI